MESYTYKWLPAVAEADSLFVACKKMSPVELLVEMHQLCWQGPLANVFSCSFASAWVCIHPYAMLSGLDIQHDGWLTPANCTHVAWTVSLPQTAPCRCAGHSGWSERGGIAVVVSLSWQPEFRSLDWTFLWLHPLFPLSSSTSVGRQLDLAWF